MNEDRILETMKIIAVWKVNPMVHRSQLRDKKQGEGELFRNFVSRLKEAAIDCNFHVKCNARDCNTTISCAEEMIRDQAI